MTTFLTTGCSTLRRYVPPFSRAYVDKNLVHKLSSRKSVRGDAEGKHNQSLRTQEARDRAEEGRTSVVEFMSDGNLHQLVRLFVARSETVSREKDESAKGRLAHLSAMATRAWQSASGFESSVVALTTVMSPRTNRKPGLTSSWQKMDIQFERPVHSKKTDERPKPRGSITYGEKQISVGKQIGKVLRRQQCAVRVVLTEAVPRLAILVLLLCLLFGGKLGRREKHEPSAHLNRFPLATCLAVLARVPNIVT